MGRTFNRLAKFEGAAAAWPELAELAELAGCVLPRVARGKDMLSGTSVVDGATSSRRELTDSLY